MEKKRRRPISEKQRQRIRQYAAANPQIDQRSIAQWASREFDRAVTQSMISRSLTTTYAYLDTKVVCSCLRQWCLPKATSISNSVT